MPRVTVSSLKGTTKGPIWFNMRGLDELQRSLENLYGQDLREELEDAVQDELEEIKAESLEIVPVDTGKLHDSAFVGVWSDGSHIRGTVGYDTPYALYVHENPDAYHKAPTRWKFLEEPLMKAQPRFIARIAAAVKRNFGK